MALSHFPLFSSVALLSERRIVSNPQTYAERETDGETQTPPAVLLRDTMWLREELLKSIWHAFTALDVDQRGKVSKSQLKVRFGSFFFFQFRASSAGL